MLRTKGGAGMDHDSYDDGYIRGILNTVRTIAMVGVSANTSRPSYFAFKYLLERGYRMIPVNPGLAGKELLGQKVYAKLADIPEPVDMVDIFRASQYARAIVGEAIELTSRKAKVLGGGIQRMSLDRTTLAGGATTAAERAAREDEESR